MSNYTITTNFTAKDNLPAGDAGKLIRGEDFGVEFSNIATAINSTSALADANSTTLTNLQAANQFVFSPTETSLYGSVANKADGGFFFRNKNTPTTGTAHSLEIAHHNGSFDNSYFTVFKYNGNVWGGIVRSGSSVAYNTMSDYRLKENVVPMESASERVKALKPSRFNFLTDSRTVDGFLAHEVQEVVPEAVTGTKDAVEEDGSARYQGIDQSKLVPLLTKALQEALERIEALESVVNGGAQ